VIGLLAVVALLGFLFQGPVAAAPSVWEFSYEGRSTNEFMWDKRARQLVNTRVPRTLAHEVLEGLSGPPDPVFVTDHRYVSVSACVPHYCPMKAFFWIDTKTGIGLGAQFTAGIGAEPGTLRLGSNGLSGRRLPSAAMAALIQWIRERRIGPDVVEFVGQDGRVSSLDADDFWPKDKFRPPPWGPAFDCQQISGTVERTICGDPDLSKLDIVLFNRVEEIRLGSDTTVARDQLSRLQRDWVTKRDADCAFASDMTACLVKRYRAQDSLLRNWIPNR